jgi:hypothetical protein
MAEEADEPLDAAEADTPIEGDAVNVRSRNGATKI